MTQCGKHAILVEHKSCSNNSNLSETILNGLSVILCMSFRVIGAVPYLKWHVFEHALHRRTFHNFSKEFRQASELPTSKCEEIPCFQVWSYQLSSIFKDFLAHIGVKMSHSVESLLRENDSFRKIHAFHKMFLCEARLWWSSNLHRITLRQCLMLSARLEFFKQFLRKYHVNSSKFHVFQIVSISWIKLPKILKLIQRHLLS